MAEKMKNVRLAKNIIVPLIFQFTAIICGFILPRIILQYFGTEINGLVNSISQFLEIIAFLELGMGAVVQSALYKPLAECNIQQASEIIASASKFFKHIAQIMFVYVIVLVLIYPILANQNFGWIYTAVLIISMSINAFAQYYFGIVDRLLLTAAQYGYVQYTVQIITLILSTSVCSLLIIAGFSIHAVKLATSLIYLLRPIALRGYVNRHFKIDRKVKYSGEPIKQKWNGVAQHIASVVLDTADSIVLTMFATLSDVSIYAVYFLVISGVKRLFLSVRSGIQSLIGELWAKQELGELKKTFGWTEWTIHTGITFVFGCTAVLIVPFVQVYTKGIYDADYIQPVFAFLIVIAHATHCLRLPYNIMIQAAGHYKQTQKSDIVAAIVNIIVSVVLVKYRGLVGVAIGTLVAMIYQTVWMAIYDSKNILKWPLKNFVKQVCADILTIMVATVLTIKIPMCYTNYLGWSLLAIEVAIIWLIIIVIINFVLYRDKIMGVINKFPHR